MYMYAFLVFCYNYMTVCLGRIPWFSETLSMKCYWANAWLSNFSMCDISTFD